MTSKHNQYWKKTFRIPLGWALMLGLLGSMARGAENLALGKMTTASGMESASHGPSNATDASATTRWSSPFRDPQWITVDLDAVYTINQVQLSWEAAYAKAYQIRFSTDNQTWTTAYSTNSGQGGTETLPVNGKARWVQIYGTQRATPYGYSLFDIKVFGGHADILEIGPSPMSFPKEGGSATAVVNSNVPNWTLTSSADWLTCSQAAGSNTGPVTITTQPNTGDVDRLATLVLSGNGLTSTLIVGQSGPTVVNASLGRPVTASSVEKPGYEASNAVDYSVTTRWASAFSDPQWICVDLGQAYQIHQVSLNWEAAYAKAYQIQTSMDNVNWTSIHSVSDGKGGFEILNITGTGRYVRMLGTQRATQYGYSLWNFEVFGVPSASTVTVTYDGQGAATPAQPSAQTLTAGGVVGTLPTPPTKVGYAFAGWFTQPGGTGTAFTASTPVNANLTVYPSWTPLGSDLLLSGLLGEVRIGNMIGNGVTVRYTPTSGTAMAKARLYLSAGNSETDLVLAAADMAPSNGGFTYTFSHPTFTANAKIRFGIMTVSTSGTEYFETNGSSLSSISSWSSFLYGAQGTNFLTVTPTQVDIPGEGGLSSLGLSTSVPWTATCADAWVSLSALSGSSDAKNLNFTCAPNTGTSTRTTSLTLSGPAGSGLAQTVTVRQAAVAVANLALNRPATASSVEGVTYSAANAVDGNSNTRWSSAFSDPQWLMVDLGSIRSITKVVLIWEAAYAKAYQIQVSTDGTTWNSAYSTTSGQGGTETCPLSAYARYVRVYCTQRGTSYGCSLLELQVYGGVQGPGITSQPTHQAASVGATASFSVTAQGSGYLAYQWFRANPGSSNFNAITGANSPSYTTPALSLADNGAQYKVSISDTETQLTSESQVATLSVEQGNEWDYSVYGNQIGVDLLNKTNGRWSDDQIYIAVIGRNPDTQKFSWLHPDGTMTACAPGDNEGPGHLTKYGQNYSNYFFSLAQAKFMKLSLMDSGRVFVSVGSPMYLKILMDAAGNVGFAGPNVLNPSDPNADVYFEWYEFSYNRVGLWINTTQVDQFGFPLDLDVYGNGKTFHKQIALTLNRDQVFSAFASETPAIFHDCIQAPYRIVAPCKVSFDAGKANGTYFDAYVNDIWNQYQNQTLSIEMWNRSRRFDGRAVGNQLVFNEVNKGNGAYVGGTFYVNKPNTQEILEGKGALASGNPIELALEAQICAAFNRHIMQDSSQWYAPSAAWYASGPANYFAKFWHDHSVEGFAYGFCYDDVSDQSSTVMTTQPEHMHFSIRW